MPHRTLAHEACRKHGHILTCYVNGKKRFRALTLAKPPIDFKIAGGAGPRASDGLSDRASMLGL